MSVRISNRQRALRFDRRRLARLLDSVLAAEGRPDAELSLSIVKDAEIAALHERWLGVSGPTDVISFPLGDEGDPDPLLGEVVVSAETASREAAARGLAESEELARYAVHGTLHLLGWDDTAPAKRRAMHKRQEELLGRSTFGPGSSLRRSARRSPTRGPAPEARRLPRRG